MSTMAAKSRIDIVYFLLLYSIAIIIQLDIAYSSSASSATKKGYSKDCILNFPGNYFTGISPTPLIIIEGR